MNKFCITKFAGLRVHSDIILLYNQIFVKRKQNNVVHFFIVRDIISVFDSIYSAHHCGIFQLYLLKVSTMKCSYQNISCRFKRLKLFNYTTTKSKLKGVQILRIFFIFYEKGPSDSSFDHVKTYRTATLAF